MFFGSVFKRPLHDFEEGTAPPIIVENPITADVMIQDEAVIMERENPAFTSNGGELQRLHAIILSV